MKKFTPIKRIHLYLLLFMLSLQSCELVAGIFKAGVWTGIIAVVLVIALIVFLIVKLVQRAKK